MSTQVLTIFTDGGSRGNPGPAALGFVVSSEEGKIIHEKNEFLGIKTNNEAEYLAFLASLGWVEEYVKSNPVQKIQWNLDSMLVVEQLNKRWKIKETRMQEFAQEIWVKLAKLGISFSISYVPREKNKHADLLVNQALDAARG